jgi:hypothetical protein
LATVKTQIWLAAGLALIFFGILAFPANFLTQLLAAQIISALGRNSALAPWTCPYQTGHLAWLDNLLAMNSRGERMRKPECGWMLL